MTVAALIVAAGRGTRAGGDIPKQYQSLLEHSVLAWSIRAFMDYVQEIVVVHHAEDTALWARVHATLPHFPVRSVIGGAHRADSVRAGLDALSPHCTKVLIHDGARPLVCPAIILAVLDALETHAGAAPAVPVTDALWIGAEHRVIGTQERQGLFRAQTPQGFHVETIRKAHAHAPETAADDVEVARAAGIEVAIVEGDEDNIKITNPADFKRAENILRQRKAADMDIRLGNGFDVHRFGPGDHVILCGLRIPHTHGLQGHSDADVGLHAITDAIYGALCAGDIGHHFPPSDDQWAGADSSLFLEHATQLAQQQTFTISNIDCTLICERPKIGPHVPEMRERIAKITNTPIDRVSVKATTTERLGFTGRGEGIACLATVTLIGASHEV